MFQNALLDTIKREALVKVSKSWIRGGGREGFGTSKTKEARSSSRAAAWPHTMFGVFFATCCFWESLSGFLTAVVLEIQGGLSLRQLVILCLQLGDREK